MRGTLELGGSGVADGGIIPAYAGNTSYRAAIFHLPRDHPRICGEHFHVGVAQLDIMGSSPHMRGTH